MKKKLLRFTMFFAFLAVSVLTLASCKGDESSQKETGTGTGAEQTEKGDFVIYAWNEEFKGFFEKYVSDEKKAGLKQYHIDGLDVKWVISPSKAAEYQIVLDTALKSGIQIDMFLAEADYIGKYADSKYTVDVTKMGVTDMSNVYNYTKQAASDAKGVVKGVSFQCCPSALIYNRVVAKDLFGTDDPVKVQEKVSTWDKFDDVAKLAHENNYYMTACESDTYRVFSNNAAQPWVGEADAEGKREVKIPEIIDEWMIQADTYVKEGYTVAADVWAEDKTKNIAADANKAFCTFGPAWYYNFCMGGSKKGDWAICEGPMAHFWGGTWLMSSANAKHPKTTAKIMNAFINDETVVTNLIKNEGQFTNNQAVNKSVAESADYKGNEFLNGQNDTKIFLELAKNIKFQNNTIYDQLCNEGLQEYFREYLKGTVTKEKAIDNFYTYITETYPDLKRPA